jgi:hypothetical protein
MGFDSQTITDAAETNYQDSVSDDLAFLCQFDFKRAGFSDMLITAYLSSAPGQP